ncbi:hypothetical protein NA56DRAFT_754655 [Hyaloscypha hepaticicola]|uniref:Uncharacterized protein n=1 Tax=Hyaloscypha hepaticicola TaxID=2082293 RepID=A0A2J6PKU5_9HELO|nr:hypothetical protein NA56DRAFT_754655 [Hyaloscypha hepaticicola]
MALFLQSTEVPTAGGKKLEDHSILEGTIVTAQSLTMYRSPDVFRDYLRFTPERWETPTPEMKEAFMPNDTGARGRNISRGKFKEKYQDQRWKRRDFTTL